MLRAKLLTDRRGQVLLPKLPFGTYCVVASSKQELTETLCLTFSPGDVGKEGLFSMELHSVGPRGSREQTLAAYERLPITKISEFRGLVEDPSGASIPKTSIEVIKMTEPGERQTLHLHSSPQGQFAARLPDGYYIASFESPGFASTVLHLLISKTESGSDLQVVLRPGLSSE